MNRFNFTNLSKRQYDHHPIIRISFLISLLTIIIFISGCSEGQNANMNQWGGMTQNTSTNPLGNNNQNVFSGLQGFSDSLRNSESTNPTTSARSLGGDLGSYGNLGGDYPLQSLGNAGTTNGNSDFNDANNRIGSNNTETVGNESSTQKDGLASYEKNNEENREAKPVVIIAHGMAANGSYYQGLANKFREAGYQVATPSNGNAFDPSHVIEAANQTGNSRVILVGHSAGGRAVQSAAARLGNKVMGVISIDGAPAYETNPNVPHAFFRHETDGFGQLVGNANPQVPPQNLINGGVQTLPGGHLVAPFGSDAENYINAAQQIEQMTANR